MTPADDGSGYTFTAELWVWDARRPDTWTFVTLPSDVSQALTDQAEAHGPPAGFGSVRVQVRAGSVSWRTSVFPDKESGCFVLPIKRAVREANLVGEGDTLTVHVRAVF